MMLIMGKQEHEPNAILVVSPPQELHSVGKLTPEQR